jgi:hypothetical protein
MKIEWSIWLERLLEPLVESLMLRVIQSYPDLYLNLWTGMLGLCLLLALMLYLLTVIDLTTFTSIGTLRLAGKYSKCWGMQQKLSIPQAISA